MTLFLFSWMLFSLWVLGAMLENQRYALRMEILRVGTCLGGAALLGASA